MQTVNQIISNQAEPLFDPSVRPQTQLPEDGRDGTFFRNFGKFERHGSTYMWKIYRPRLQTLVGYSKPRDMAEKANKQELLLDIIRRLAKGYIRDGFRIEMYRNYSPSDDDSVKFLTLYGSRFIPEPVVIDQTWLMKFLKNLYNPVVYNYGTEMFPTGGKPAPAEGKSLIPEPAKIPLSNDPFDLNRGFKSSEELLDYVDKLDREGHPKGRISDYYRTKLQAFTANR